MIILEMHNVTVAFLNEMRQTNDLLKQEFSHDLQLRDITPSFILGVLAFGNRTVIESHTVCA